MYPGHRYADGVTSTWERAVIVHMRAFIDVTDADPPDHNRQGLLQNAA